MRRAPVIRGAFPPVARLDVMAMATRTPSTYHGAATRWSLDDLVAALKQRTTGPMSRSSLWRVLEAADLQPHRRVYWLNSHDPDCEAKTPAICSLSLNAHRFFAQGRVVICPEEKTGMQMLQRPYPTQPREPGTPEKREHADIRHGVRALIASCVVPTGHVLWNPGETRPSADGAAPLATVVHHLPEMPRYDGVVENLQTPWSLAVCRPVAVWCSVALELKHLQRGAPRRALLSDPTPQQVLHSTPQHGAWLNQVARWLRVLARRFLTPGAGDAAQDFATRLGDYLARSNTHHAQPSRWT